MNREMQRNQARPLHDQPDTSPLSNESILTIDSQNSSEQAPATSTECRTTQQGIPALGSQQDAFRLVRFVGMDRDGYISLSVRSTRIHASTYTALSYVWGQDLPSYVIRVNGCIFWIRTNLWLFFMTCSDQIEAQDFWIDAICIDQGDLSDKTRQVPLMGQIYGKADNVLVWLQPSVAERSSSCREGNASAASSLSELCSNHMERHTPYAQAAIDAASVSGSLLRFLTHEYWSRLWIVQELQLASTIVIQYGTVTFSHQQLTALINDLDMYPVIQTKLEEHFPDGFEDLLRPLRKTFGPLDTVSRRPCLFESIIMYGDRECALTHDHVYGLLSISSDGSNYVPDYDQPLLTLLTQLLRCSTKVPNQTQMIRIMEIIQIDPADLAFPICEWWRPSFADEVLNKRQRKDDRRKQEEIQRNVKTPPFDICCSHHGCLEFVRDPGLLFGIPHLGLLLGVRMNSELNFVIAPSRIEELRKDKVLHRVSMLRFEDGHDIGSCYRLPSLLSSPTWNITHDWKQVRLKATPESAYALLTVGLRPNLLGTFDIYPYTTNSCCKALVEVDMRGRPLDTAAGPYLLPRAVLFRTEAPAGDLIVYIETTRVKTWDDLHDRFQSDYFVWQVNNVDFKECSND